jgi:hypothetical protein
MRIFLIILFFITSCSVPNWWKPRGYLLFSMMPKGGTPGHDLGWIHGCQSGAGTQFGGEIYMSFYTWSRDTDMTVSNPDIAKIRNKYGNKELKNVNWNDPEDVKRNISDYNEVFWSAHFVCRQTILGSIQMGGINPPLPGETRYDPAAHHLGSIYKLNGKGDARIGSTGYW